MKCIATIAVTCVFMTISFSPVQAQAPDKAAALATGFENGAFEISNYNTACYFALAGNNKLALTYLRKALQDGFSDAKTLQEDSDLNSLHQEAEWSTLVKLAQTNASNKTGVNTMFFNQPGFWESKSLQTPYRENISTEEKVAGLSKFWSEAKYNFINFDLVPTVNIDSLYLAYLPKVTATPSTLAYYKVLTEMCAQLKDAHTNVNAPAELREEVYARPLLRTRLVEDKVLVVEAAPSLQEKGLKAGMEVVMVNGLPVKEYAAKSVAPYQSCSTPQDRDVRSYEYALLSGSVKQPVDLQLKDEKGHLSHHTVARVSTAERAAKFSYPSTVYKTLPGNISYLAINTFANDSGTKVFMANYPAIAQSKALILDLRNNGGGNTDWAILSCLIDTATMVHKTYMRQYIPTFRAWGRPQTTRESFDGIGPDKTHRYSNPVIVLISARTFSAAEDFAAAFKSLKRGILLGEATGGSTGQPLGITLPGNLTARICTKRDQYADGSDFVGKGILPDMVVVPTVSDVRKGVDTQLEAALKELRR